MLAIKDSYKEVDWSEIENLHLEYCIKLLKSKIKSINKTKCNRYYRKIYKVVDHVVKGNDVISLRDIILCEPEKMIEVNNALMNKISNLVDTDKANRTIKHIFDYKSFIEKSILLEDETEWGAYQLSRKLNVRVCPYCNRHYTNTVIDEEATDKNYIIRPEFDHFYPRSKYPFLGLSLYNLIPSCHICNSKKSDVVFSLNDYINPYISGFGDGLKFNYSFSGEHVEGEILSEERIKIDLIISGNDADKIEGNIEAFKLKEIYDQSHRDIVVELIAKKRKHPGSYLKSVQNLFEKAKLSKEEVYRLALGNYCNEKDFGNRPLSKMTKDIALELGLIKKDLIK